MCSDPHQNTLEMYYPSMAIEPVKMSAPKLPRYDHCTTVLDGKIFFIGGKLNDKWHILTQLFNTSVFYTSNTLLHYYLRRMDPRSQGIEGRWMLRSWPKHVVWSRSFIGSQDRGMRSHTWWHHCCDWWNKFKETAEQLWNLWPKQK